MDDDGQGRSVRLAKTLRVVRERGGPARLYIDGELFEYATLEGFAIHPRRGEAPGVTLTIYADRVEVIDTLDAAEAADTRTPL